jgi:hypothetical protein
MIRDPSDGSVREKPAIGIPITEQKQAPVIDTTTSGLPLASTKPENIARLEKSREWLRDYRAGKFKQTDGDG